MEKPHKKTTGKMVAKEHKSVMTSAGGSIHVTMHIISDAGSEKIEGAEHAAEIKVVKYLR